MFISILLIVSIIILVGPLVFTNTTKFDRMVENAQKKREEKDRLIHPDYWSAKDYVDKCAKAKALAEARLIAIKRDIDQVREELVYLPKDEALAVEKGRLYNLRKGYFYAKGNLSNCVDELEKACKTLAEEEAKRKNK